MERYSIYVDPHTGQAGPATDDQIENESGQILWIAGVEAVTQPPIWIGPYNGEMLFLPSKFEAEDGSSVLNIPIGNITLTEITNINPGHYQVHYLQNGQQHVAVYQGMYTALTSLSQL